MRTIGWGWSRTRRTIRKSLSWNQKGLASAVAVGGATLSFGYDPLDYRVARSGGPLGNRDYYLEGEHLEAEYSGSQLQAKYLRGVSTDELLAGWSLNAQGQLLPSIYQHDHLNSVNAISDANGPTLQTQRYSAFGQVQVIAGNSNNRLRYTGRELDQDTGLYYYRARYYDPAIGRFISEDPIGLAGGMNPYAYVNNNPFNLNDPMGLDPYTSRYPSWDAAALDAARSITQIANARSVEYGGLIYQNRLRIPERASYSYTDLVTQNDRNHVSIEFDTLLTPRMIEPGVGPRPIHSHPIGVEESFSLDDVKDAARLADQFLGRGYGLPYVEYLYSFQANDVKSLNLAKPDSPPSFSTIGRPDSPLRVNMNDDAGAAGGFLLYPNKPNNNNARIVYGK